MISWGIDAQEMPNIMGALEIVSRGRPAAADPAGPVAPSWVRCARWPALAGASRIFGSGA